MARYIGIVSSCETGSFDDIEVVRFLADALSNSCPSAERYLITRIVQEQKTFLLQIFPKNIDVLDLTVEISSKIYDWQEIKNVRSLWHKAQYHKMKDETAALQQQIDLLNGENSKHKCSKKNKLKHN